MIPHWKTAFATALCALACSRPGLAQVAPATILTIDTANVTGYVWDTSDPSKFATDPGPTTATFPRTFGQFVIIDEIVAVNGQPVKGTVVYHARSIGLSTNPAPGQAIADTNRGTVADVTFEILKPDGTQIGTIVTLGLAPAAPPPPPGAPLEQTGGNMVIVGGTAGFLGVRGQMGVNANPPQGNVPARLASITEDPANRRQRAGGRGRFVLHVIPMSQPQIASTANGPAVTHSSDFSLVTASKPASAGENLSLFATGLGPTVPGVDPGKPFPASPLVAVNSPVDVTVNGNPAQVLAAVGFPGAVDAFQVNFQVPPGTAKGPATVQVSAAWITGPAVTIQVQ
jgi:uncharacterized protein (TIGR03437 family)